MTGSDSDDPPGDRRVIVIVCDSLGIGGAPDAAEYGDAAANTLAHVASAADGLDLPLLESWGLGSLTDIQGVAPRDPSAVIARLTPTGAGKDSISGHWELMGCRMTTPFPTYPEGFPAEIISRFEDTIGRAVLGNRAASGTVIIEELGPAHVASGRPIVYTSADSVFQVAAHVDVVELDRLYEWCEIARSILTGKHGVGRVIARPFRGEPGSYERIAGRRDYGIPPVCETVLDRLTAHRVPVHGIGKIDDLFAGQGIDSSQHTSDNESGLDALDEWIRRVSAPAFCFVNLVDFDQEHGHRNDPVGYARALERLDRRLHDLTGRLHADDRVIVTGDHGTDPTLTASTDHTRERVPCLCWGPDMTAGADLGVRRTFSDVGATVLDLFGVPAKPPAGGTSFAPFLA